MDLELTLRHFRSASGVATLDRSGMSVRRVTIRPDEYAEYMGAAAG